MVWRCCHFQFCSSMTSVVCPDHIILKNRPFMSAEPTWIIVIMCQMITNVQLLLTRFLSSCSKLAAVSQTCWIDNMFNDGNQKSAASNEHFRLQFWVHTISAFTVKKLSAGCWTFLVLSGRHFGFVAEGKGHKKTPIQMHVLHRLRWTVVYYAVNLRVR